MKTKELIIRILIGLATFTLFYLLACFYSASFNIKEWSEPVRGFIALFGGTTSLLISARPLEIK